MTNNPINSKLIPGVGRDPLPAYRGNGKYIFISYAHSDSDRVFPEIKRFQDMGFNVWYDEGIGAGNEWLKDIVEHLDKCDLFIVFLTNRSVESRNVKKEIKFAINKEKDILPIYLDDIDEINMDLELEFELSIIQGINKPTLDEEEYIFKFTEAFQKSGFKIQKFRIDKEIETFVADSDLKSKEEIPKNTFEYLNYLIKSENDEITLTEDIILSNSDELKFLDGITIKRDNLIINGDNHSIDANKKSGIFNILSKNVIIKNLCIKNAHSNNGAILNKSNDVYFEKCKFIDNSSSSSGGAINNYGKIRLQNCNIKSNNSKVNGGAIFNNKGAVLEINGTEFLNNTSEGNGGAIFSKSNIFLSDCIFDSNSSMKKGGAINFQKGSNLEATKTSFINNSALSGGAIMNWGKFIVSNCIFDSNYSKADGGAINCQKSGSFIANHSEFKNNNSKMKGAVFIIWGNVETNDCLFKFNTSAEDGGVFNNQLAGFLKINASKFINNSSDEKGGVIINFGKFNVFDSIFKSNTSKSEGGAINNQKNTFMKIKGCSFIDNCSYTKGGALLNFGEIELIDSLFENNNSKDDGGAINSQKDSILKINRSNFINNNANDCGGAICNWGKLKLDEIIFENNISNIDGGAIYNKSAGTLKGINLIFSRNKANDGGAIYSLKSYSVNLKQCEYKENKPNNIQYFE